MDQFDERYLATTVLKAFDILTLLGNRTMTANDLCIALDMNKSTVHRLLYTMEYAGYIERNPVTRIYRPGMKLVQLCSTRINDIELLTEAKPFLMALVKEINQVVHLAVMKDNRAMFIDKIDTINTIRMYSAIGRSIPLHCSAVGKALLLDKSDEEVHDLLNKAGIEIFTNNTLTTPEALLAQLKTARQCGFTIDDSEHEEHVCCIAAPIYDYRGRIIAAVSTAALKSERTDRQHLISALKNTTLKISEILGYVPGNS